MNETHLRGVALGGGETRRRRERRKRREDGEEGPERQHEEEEDEDPAPPLPSHPPRPLRARSNPATGTPTTRLPHTPLLPPPPPQRCGELQGMGQKRSRRPTQTDWFGLVWPIGLLTERLPAQKTSARRSMKYAIGTVAPRQKRPDRRALRAKHYARHMPRSRLAAHGDGRSELRRRGAGLEKWSHPWYKYAHSAAGKRVNSGIQWDKESHRPDVGEERNKNWPPDSSKFLSRGKGEAKGEK